MPAGNCSHSSATSLTWSPSSKVVRSQPLPSCDWGHSYLSLSEIFPFLPSLNIENCKVSWSIPTIPVLGSLNLGWYSETVLKHQKPAALSWHSSGLLSILTLCQLRKPRALHCSLSDTHYTKHKYAYRHIDIFIVNVYCMIWELVLATKIGIKELAFTSVRLPR